MLPRYSCSQILKLRTRLNSLYEFHTGQELDRIEKVMDRDSFFSVEEAIEFGVVDEVLVKRGVEEEEEK